MTYEELLKEIEAHQNDYSPQATDVTAWDALRAVVELHKTDSESGYCEICPDFNYPCQTIQAITKELK
jgi:hypothetical protein